MFTHLDKYLYSQCSFYLHGCHFVDLIYLFVDFFRGFNDAINGFDDDGWSLISYGAAENLIISINSNRNIWITSDSVDPHPLSGGILCVKASTLLQVSFKHRILGNGVSAILFSMYCHHHHIYVRPLYFLTSP